MINKKNIKGKLGPRAITKNKNLFLKPSGGFNLIEKFPAYEKKKITKKRRDKVK